MRRESDHLMRSFMLILKKKKKKKKKKKSWLYFLSSHNYGYQTERRKRFRIIFIMKTRLYSFHSLKPHTCSKTGVLQGYTLIFLFLLKNIDCGYSLEPHRIGGSKKYPLSVFWAEIWQLLEFFIWKFSVLVVKCSMYLNRRVVVMIYLLHFIPGLIICRFFSIIFGITQLRFFCFTFFVEIFLLLFLRGQGTHDSLSDFPPFWPLQNKPIQVSLKFYQQKKWKFQIKLLHFFTFWLKT